MIEGELQAPPVSSPTESAPARARSLRSWRFLVTRRMPATKAVPTVPQAQLPLHKQSANGPGSFSLKASVGNYRNGGALAALQAVRSHRNEGLTESRLGRRTSWRLR